MRGRSLRIALMGAAIVMVATVVPITRADAATTSACTTTSGVTVIVDFAGFHHGIARGCAADRPATALAAMQAAGFETAGTTQYGDAFLCRIDKLPSPKVEPCTATPAAKSSWSFYWAKPTDTTWTYSRVGVLSYAPPPGTIIAFAFGNLAKPGVLPSAAIRAASTPTTTSPPTAAVTTTIAAAPTVAAAAGTTTPIPDSPATVAAPTIPPTTKVRATVPATTSTTTTTTVATQIEDRSASKAVSASSSSGSGSAIPAMLGTVLVLALGAGAAFAVRARRRRAT